MYQNILVPIDGSETAGRGLDEAIELARTLGARIRLLYVLTTPWIAADTMAAVAEDLVTQMRTTGECILHQATTARPRGRRPGGAAADRSARRSRR